MSKGNFTPGIIKQLNMLSSLQIFYNKHYFFWVTIFFSIALLVTYIIFGVTFFSQGLDEKDFGWQYVRDGNSYVISQVSPEFRDKLQVGDKILAINGDTSLAKTFDIIDSVSTIKRKLTPNSNYIIEISRNSKNYIFYLKSSLNRNYEKIGIFFTFLLSSWVFYACAILVGLAKPKEKLTQKVTIALFSLAAFSLLIAIKTLNPTLTGLSAICYCLLWLSYPTIFPLGFDVYSKFPPGIKTNKFWTAIKYFLYIYSTIILIGLQIACLAGIYNIKEPFTTINFLLNNDTFLYIFDSLWDLLIYITFFLLIAVIIYNYSIINSLDQKRRIKWVAYGSLIGITTSLTKKLISFLLITIDKEYILTSNYFFLFARFAELTITLVPISFAYVIIKHQVFDITVVIRQGLQYLLAKNVLRLLLGVEAFSAAIIIGWNPNLTVREIISPSSGYFYLIGITTISLFYRNQIMVWLDKIFFRAAYDREKILLDLISEIKKLDSITTISKLVSSQLEEALHPKSTLFFYKEENKDCLTLNHSSVGINPSSILTNSQLIEILEDNPRSRKLDFIDSLPPLEKEWLTSLNLQLIVPMMGRNKNLTGLLLLGEKLSEEPYSQNDYKLLEAIASQLAIVYENNVLLEKVDKEEKIKKEVLDKLAEQNINLVKECPFCHLCFDNKDDFCPGDKTLLTLSLPVERIIENKYKLEKLIGKGGMGAVYQAIDLRLSRKVAIKVLHGSMFGNKDSIRRFEKEAKIIARLNHPNIIAIYDYGKLATDGAYLVMELIKGISLKHKLQQEKCLAPKLVAQIFNQIFEAIKVAHSKGIIHRDLKPDNILIADHNNQIIIKILDFGIAKLNSIDPTEANSLTAPGTIIGTFGYMPPEQFSAEPVDERSDIFSLGVIIVECLTGSKPFLGKTVYELMGNMLKHPFHLPITSPETRLLDLLIQQCLAKEPKNRFSSVAELQEELMPILTNLPDNTFAQNVAVDFIDDLTDENKAVKTTPITSLSQKTQIKPRN